MVSDAPGHEGQFYLQTLAPQSGIDKLQAIVRINAQRRTWKAGASCKQCGKDIPLGSVRRRGEFGPTGRDIDKVQGVGGEYVMLNVRCFVETLVLRLLGFARYLGLGVV